jgi:two-component system nitrogen regulation response regulator GlnG
VEQELFGHAPAGTMDSGRPGLFDMADGGTIFLDEIDAAPMHVQAKLLRTLESGMLQRLGSGAAVPVNVRVIAASRLDLAAARERGGFRGELLDRLSVFPIAMPPLSDREADLEALARHFVARHVARQPHAAVPAVSPEFVTALRERPWPGNVRELRHAVEHATIVARGGMLRPEHLPPLASPAAEPSAPLDMAHAAVTAAVKDWLAAARTAYGGLAEPDLHRRAVEIVEATVLREALAHTGGNRTAAAKLLGLDRATLRTKLRLHRLDD